MKILYINEYFTEEIKTGANVIAYNSFFFTMEAGNECYFFSNNEGTPLKKQKYNNLFPKSHINRKGLFNTIKYRVNSIFNFEAKRNLEKVLKEIKPDIVHIHAIMELSYSIIVVLKKLNIPYIITVHDAGFICPVMGTKSIGCTRCSINIINSVINKCSRNNYFNSLYVALKFFISKKILKIYPPKVIISPSNALKQYINNTKYANNIPIVCVYNSLDVDFINISPNYENQDYFLFVGNLLDVKGVNILLEAIKDLSSDIEFHIIGTGLQERKYKKFISENNLTNVKLLGKKNRKELINEYQNCIATIVPSNLFEIFGMINIESFANGKPVIASNIGGIPEIVEHNVNGLLFEPGNVEQLKECILKYWNNPNLVVEHGKKGYEKVLTNYTEDIYFKKLIKLYEEILNDSQKHNN